MFIKSSPFAQLPGLRQGKIHSHVCGKEPLYSRDNGCTVAAIVVYEHTPGTVETSPCKFDSAGIARGSVDDALGRIQALRLNVHSDSENWAILSEVGVKRAEDAAANSFGLQIHIQDECRAQQTFAQSVIVENPRSLSLDVSAPPLTALHSSVNVSLKVSDFPMVATSLAAVQVPAAGDSCVINISKVEPTHYGHVSGLQQTIHFLRFNRKSVKGFMHSSATQSEVGSYKTQTSPIKRVFADKCRRQPATVIEAKDETDFFKVS
ncbi:hypothetical protein HUJ05_006002 [Dendroctonus ponderosae]|nr:hypothetical protein HUJ05_006002 [Dendroctonus ponderosae]